MLRGRCTGKAEGDAQKGKGPPRRPFHEFGPVRRTRAVSQNVPKEDEVQAEGCPVKTITFPLPVTQTEISLDIGSPSFRYVDDKDKVGRNIRVCKARYMNKRAIKLPEQLETQLD